MKKWFSVAAVTQEACVDSVCVSVCVKSKRQCSNCLPSHKGCFSNMKYASRARTGHSTTPRRTASRWAKTHTRQPTVYQTTKKWPRPHLMPITCLINRNCCPPELVPTTSNQTSVTSVVLNKQVSASILHPTRLGIPAQLTAPTPSHPYHFLLPVLCLFPHSCGVSMTLSP